MVSDRVTGDRSAVAARVAGHQRITLAGNDHRLGCCSVIVDAGSLGERWAGDAFQWSGRHQGCVAFGGGVGR
jgi:hypothetical protein